MKVAAVAGLALLIADIVAAQGSPANISVIPAVANAPGANDTYWRTDLYLVNPSSERTVEVTVILGKTGQIASKTYELAAGQTRVWENFLETEFSYSGVGGLFLYTPVPTDRFGARARVYTQTACGPFGQFEEAQPATGPFLENDIEFTVRPGERLNVGFFARFGYGAESNLTLVVTDDAGAPVASLPIGGLPEFSHYQTSLSALLPEGVVTGRVRLKIDGRGLPYCDWTIPYLSVVNNTSGSAEFWALNHEYICEL